MVESGVEGVDGQDNSRVLARAGGNRTSQTSPRKGSRLTIEVGAQPLAPTAPVSSSAPAAARLSGLSGRVVSVVGRRQAGVRPRRSRCRFLDSEPGRMATCTCPSSSTAAMRTTVSAGDHHLGDLRPCDTRLALTWRIEIHEERARPPCQHPLRRDKGQPCGRTTTSLCMRRRRPRPIAPDRAGAPCAWDQPSRTRSGRRPHGRGWWSRWPTGCSRARRTGRG